MQAAGLTLWTGDACWFVVLTTAATLLFSHTQSTKLYSGAPPWASSILPSALKLRLTYSCGHVHKGNDGMATSTAPKQRCMAWIACGIWPGSWQAQTACSHLGACIGCHQDLPPLQRLQVINCNHGLLRTLSHRQELLVCRNTDRCDALALERPRDKALRFRVWRIQDDVVPCGVDDGPILGIRHIVADVPTEAKYQPEISMQRNSGSACSAQVHCNMFG